MVVSYLSNKEEQCFVLTFRILLLKVNRLGFEVYCVNG